MSQVEAYAAHVCYNRLMNEEVSPHQERINAIETAMQQADFWADKDKAHSLIKELQDLKTMAEGGGKCNAVT